MSFPCLDFAHSTLLFSILRTICLTFHFSGLFGYPFHFSGEAVLPEEYGGTNGTIDEHRCLKDLNVLSYFPGES